MNSGQESPAPSRGELQQQSRMEKLFALMELASTAPGVRRLSAKQIASIVETRPEDCNLIIGRLLPMVLSSNSDIRVCSAFSIELVAKSAKIETLNYNIEVRSLKDFNLEKVLDDQMPLLASIGAEFEADPRMTAKMQKQNLKQVFSIAEGVEIDDMTEEIVKEEDLTVKPADSPSDKPMSAREKAMAKRKAKMSNNTNVKKATVGSGVNGFVLAENEEEPLCKSICYLVENLFSPVWFIRHGALLGLEAIFAGQGHAGPQECRQSLAYSLVSLLALDRFGDYNGDHMVAPVREAAAAVLGLLARDDLTDAISLALSQLIACPELWQIRHGGLMGLFRLNFTNADTISSLVNVAPSLLADSDDDVKTLTAKLLCRVIPLVKNVKLDAIFESLLSLLEQADDLSSSVSPVLELLRILAENGYSSERLQSLLLPHFRSPLSIIRKQCLQTVKALKCVDVRVKRQCLQVVCLEDDLEIANLAFSILNGTTLNELTDFLPVIFTEIGAPYPPELFHFYQIGTTDFTNTPPSHELSFKTADAMIVEPNTAARQRLMLARLFAGVFEDVSEQPRSSLFNALVCLLKPSIKCPLDSVDDSVRSKLFKAIHDNEKVLQSASEYFASGDLEVFLELAAELLSGLLEDKDILSLPLGEYNQTAPIIKLCSFKQLDSNRSHKLLEECSEKLQLSFVLLSSTAQVSVEECLDIIFSHIDSQKELAHASTVFYSLFRRFPREAITALLTKMLPIMKTDTVDAKRLSIIKSIERIVSADESDIIPFAPFLLFPCLARMSDQCEEVRRVASPVFAALVRLIPLDVSLPAGMDAFAKDLEECRSFITALSDPSRMLSNQPVPESIKATLRPYQQTGYSWMLFLQRYGLHGALCDDMGLGKTLQTLCCLAAFYEQQQPTDTRIKRSLILCPSSLLGHWKHEAEQYAPHLKTLLYAGRPQERRKLLAKATDCHLIVAPYDVFRNDNEHFVGENYGYLVMDEAHLVKNVKSKLWVSVREVRAQHRLCLTGTPIQNHVGELWALFDILMPGYLGDLRCFADRYAKPIQAASQANSGARDFAVAQERLKQLHKQVLPFILRRMKEDVLTDLPPKVIQDYECELSEEQLLLYKALVEPVSDDTCDAAEAADADSTGAMQKMAAFRKICIHPIMAMDDLPQELRLQLRDTAARNNRPIDDIALSPKLELLRDLMVSCGIADGDAVDVASKHRMLIFAQQKRALDMVDSILLKRHFPHVAHLRLDGDVPATARHQLVQRFNRDPSIPVMLLTTKVGGLGLNLTGADTVVFLEHDWNPMADVQAMDRAHRLGQRRSVSVYRLITKGTVEERIMGLQQWKLRVANAVVNQQNASMASMDTSNLLDLLGDQK